MVVEQDYHRVNRGIDRPVPRQQRSTPRRRAITAMKNASKRYARRPGPTRRRSVWLYSVDCCQFKERLCRSIHFGPGPRM